MNYTDQEILDLEDSLESVGHSVEARYCIVEPDSWDQKEMGVFGLVLCRFYKNKLEEQGLIVGNSHMLIPTLERKGRSVFTIQGPSIRAKKALDEIYEKYNCQMALEFGE